MAMGQNRGRTQTNPRSLANLKPWQPGESGNPGGRPKDAAKAVREKFGGSPSAIVDELWKIGHDETQTGNARVSALRELYDRGWGKAPAFEAMKGQDPLGLSAVDEEIQKIAADLKVERDELAERRKAS